MIMLLCLSDKHVNPLASQGQCVKTEYDTLIWHAFLFSLIIEVIVSDRISSSGVYATSSVVK